MKQLGPIINLSLLLHRAAHEAQVSPIVAMRFLDALVAFPNEAAERIVAERRQEAERRAAEQVRKQTERAKYLRPKP